ETCGGTGGRKGRAPDKAVREEAEVTAPPLSVGTEVICCFLQGVSYEISYPNQTCKKAPLKTPFRPIEIPPDAKLLGKVVLGTNLAPGMGVLINAWAGAVPVLKGERAKYKLAFTEFGCLPISSQIHVENVGWIFTNFYNLVIGIEDPNEFIPPPSCDKALTNYFLLLLTSP
uniref:Ependymin n=1 Tax=Paramormyrops kingsleyae TaxID=1676925 RepID=A0A3B3QEC7_9TELE